MNEKLIGGYAAFTSADEVMSARAGSPEISPTFVVASIALSSGGAGATVAWTVDVGC